MGKKQQKKRTDQPIKKIGVVIDEFKNGTLKSGSGAQVKSKPQAIAIGLSEARKAGAKIPKKR